MAINAERLNARIARLATVGASPDGGVTRVSLSPEYLEARQVVASWMQEAGLVTRVDAAGNLIGRRDGKKSSLGALAIGSHIDTVINGGRYDGTVGVLGGIEVAQALLEDGTELEHPLEVISFLEEEGTRWGTTLLGSRAMLGGVVPADLHERRDRQGLVMAEGLRAGGVDPGRIQEATRDPQSIAAYVEMHIEQGAVLEAAGAPVGVVTGIAGPLMMELRLRGRTDHAGATPMNMRRDALVSASRLVLAVQQLAWDQAPTSVATVGRLEVKPGAVNAIPGEVMMTFDVRDIVEANRDQMEASLRRILADEAASTELEYELKVMSRIKPVLLTPEMVEMVASACSASGLPVHRLPSGAGHDAQIVAGSVPTAMIFVRSRGGISHSPAEYTSPEDVAAGTQVLYRTLLALDAVQVPHPVQ